MQKRWHVVEAGQGFPLVLLHGLGASSFSWRHNLGPLSRHFRVLAPDLPGHGLTPPGVVRDFRLETLAQGILELLQHYGVKEAAVAGNSLGGSLALLLARARPTGFPALVLLAPAVRLSRPPRLFYPLRLPWVGLLLSAMLGKWTVRLALGQAYHRRSLITPQVVDAYAVTFRSLANRLALRRLVCQIEAWPPARVEALLADITVPLCLIWGKEDGILPWEQALWLRNRLPQAELHLLPQVGHAPQEEAPERVNALITAFLHRILAEKEIFPLPR